MVPLSTIQWIEQYQKGDKKIFSKLYKAYYKKVYYIALKISRNQADAKDIAQDTFIQVQKSLGSLKDPNVFEQWLNRIVISKASDLFRKNKTTSFPEEHSVFQVSKEERRYMLPEEQSHFTSDQEMLGYFIDQLDVKYRVVLVLSYFNDMKIREIANVLNIPEGTVKSRMNTGKEQLKEMITQYQNEEQIPLNFKISEVSIVLSAFFANEFAHAIIPIPSIPHTISPTSFHNVSILKFATVGLCTCLAGTCAYASYQAFQLYNKQKKPSPQVLQANQAQTKTDFGPIVYQDRVFDNPEDAFYELTLWAHCEVEMKEKAQEEIKAIAPLYEELKKEQGTYWKLLEFRGWSKQFEEMK